MDMTSFAARRPAANSLPAFSLPPPSDVPRASDGISPSISSVNTGSSQSSHAAVNVQYTYSQPMHGSWASPGPSTYQVHPSQHLGPSGYGGRPGLYASSNSMGYSNQRNSHSPGANGDNLPAPPFDQVHHPFSTPVSNSGGQASPAHLSSGPQPPTLPSSTSNVDSYTHSRAANPNPSYYASHHQSGFSGFTTQPPPTQASPTSSGPGARGLSSLASQNQPSALPPASYRPYSNPYPSLSMGAPMMAGMHQPGSQIAMLPGMGVSQYATPHPLAYGPPPTNAQPPPERPFKCEQCVQAFSRNHDLKRHKRIHLSVKPFSCTVCSKSFSRKDALKRHRLVKGCEPKVKELNDDSLSDKIEDKELSPMVKQEC